MKKKLALDIEQEETFHVSSAGTFQQGDFAIGGGGLTMATQQDSGIRETGRVGIAVEDTPDAAFGALSMDDGPGAGGSAAATPAEDATMENMARDLDGGIRFDDLEKEVHLGAGASGVVWKVKDRSTQKIYALKQIPLEADEAKRKQLIVELRTMHECHCPAIITCFGLFYHESAFYIVLELMDAGSLMDIIDRSPGKKLPENIIAHIASQVSIALRYLHEQRRLIHRDLKPPNILVNKKGEFKVADFGVSGVMSASKSNCASWVGTVTYMSPERISGEKYGFRSDIWSMGLMLMECAVGMYPYVKEDTPQTLAFWDLLELITDNPPPTLPKDGSFSDDFRGFVKACLAKDAKRRPTAADCLESPFVLRYQAQPIDLGAWVSGVLGQ